MNAQAFLRAWGYTVGWEQDPQVFFQVIYIKLHLPALGGPKNQSQAVREGLKPWPRCSTSRDKAMHRSRHVLSTPS